MSSQVRVLVVDDSAFFQRRISEILEREPGIRVVGMAADGLSAVTEVQRLKPDVVTMDVEMPVMDGISAVKRIMARTPTPIVMFSSFTHQGAEATLNALDAGAVDFLPKQTEQPGLLSSRVLALGQGAKTRRDTVVSHSASPTAWTHRRGHFQLVVVGASTGGPVAIQNLLAVLPENFSSPILLIVHMPESFTPAYARRLDSQCSIRVKEAADGDLLRPGQAYLAPGGKQMVLEQTAKGVALGVKESSNGQTYRPSVDVTMGSAAEVYGDRVLAVVLTGMGSDGKEAARLLKQKGATVWTQDQASCVVYGMPQAVEKSGLSDRVLPLGKIGPMMARVI